MTQATGRKGGSAALRGAGSPCGRVVRRSVQCDGVRGVLARRDGRWTVDNESEIRMLAALGRDSPGAIDRFKALAETLNADLVDVGSLRWLNGRLSELVAATPDEVPTEWGDPQVMAQVAFACACMSDPSNSNGAQWLAWALSARLQNNLVDGPLPGSGWLSMRHPDRYWSRRFDRDTCWTTMMPAEFWARLRTHHEPWLRDATAASDPRAAATLLRRLARSDHGVVLDLVASHLNTPRGVLRRISKSPHNAELVPAYVELRTSRIAQNRRTPQRLLRRLARSESERTRVAVAAHPSTPVSVLRALADDNAGSVRIQVARHWQGSDPVMRRLARDCSVGVRRAVALNPYRPNDVHVKLLHDRMAAVRRAAIRNSHVYDRSVYGHVEDRALTVRREVAYQTGWGLLLGRLAQDPKADVRAAAAANPRTPALVLESLASDPHDRVRGAVAGNPSTPAEALRVLACDGDRWVRARVAGNPSAPPELLAELLESDTSDIDGDTRAWIAANAAAPAQMLRMLSADGDNNVRWGLATNPSTPANLLAELASDHYCWIRKEVALNPSAPCGVLATLAGDRDCLVRAAAARTLCGRRRDRIREFIDDAGNDRTDWWRACVRAAGMGRRRLSQSDVTPPRHHGLHDTRG